MFLKKTRHEGHQWFGSTPDGDILRANGLDRFETIWTIEAPWVEEPNYRRRGWSGMSRIELNGTTPTPIGIYLKRQENHGYRSIENPFRYRPTAYREYKRLVAMNAAGIAAPEVLYYGERQTGEKMQAILMTREIPQNIPLDDYLLLSGNRSPDEVRRLIADTAILIAKLHRHHFQHCSLYGKHVLVSGFDAAQPTPPQIGSKLVPYLIDVEKSRQRLSRMAIAVRDLNQLYRHVPWTTAQWDTFLAHYATAGQMESLKPILAWLIHRKARRKQARRRPPV
ncbi:MAG: lipopolysaccharide kinase InaA family protein [Deltaproteobacteria bacterium]|nr:lipopolysaccharide kinase InaA family protein [Deltaproteobacteria bacterium]